MLNSSQFPKLLHVRQSFPDRALPDLAGAVRRELREAGFLEALPPGASVAVGVGSRGINNLPVIVRAAVDTLRELDLQPFLFPAMGSHGAATADGQADVLRHAGLTETAMGCEIRSSLDVVSLGRTPDGIEALMDRKAYESDGVLLINRVKWHTGFDGALESGIYKMMAIGLGKLAGAQRYHTIAYRRGMEQVIRSVGRQVLGTGKIVGGLAILEGSAHETAQVKAMPAATMERQEEELLRTVKGWMARIPVAHLDLLILDEIGKVISGTGMDTKVVNRTIRAQTNVWPHLPRIERVYVRDLSPHSYGNAVGIGMADVVHSRLVEKVDWNATWVNSLTASTPSGSRLPIHFASDRECLERVSATVGTNDPATLRIGWIRNTLELSDLYFSETLRAEIQANPALSIDGDAHPWDFHEQGDLASPFA